MKRRVQGLLFSVCLIILYCCSISVCASETDVKGRVLYISSYSYGLDSVQEQIDGIRDTLGEGYHIDYEYMNTDRVEDETSVELFGKRLEYLMANAEPYDVVMVGDDAALTFVIDNKEGMFKRLPVVFLGVSDEKLIDKALEQSLITGVIKQIPMEETLELATDMFPKADKVVAVLDNTSNGKVQRKVFYGLQEQYPKLEFSEINATKLTTAELQKSLKALEEKDTILLFITMVADGSGKKYSMSQAAETMMTYSVVPAFCMTEAGLGNGFVGGMVNSNYLCSAEAAKLALRIMDGEVFTLVAPQRKCPSVCTFDEKMLERYGIDISDVPNDAKLLNHTESFAERNREAMILIVVLSILVAAVAGWAIWDSYKKHRIMTKLKEAKEIMENASQHDFLTGLPNRSKFMKDLEERIDKKLPCTVFMMDIDDFKSINDTLGHSAGDIALKAIGDRMKDIRSNILTPYRFAGDEFIMILHSEQEQIIEKIAYECRNLFTKEVKFKNKKHQITGSIGIATYPKDATDIESLIMCADAAMYEVKRSGKNQFAYYKADTTAKKSEKKD